MKKNKICSRVISVLLVMGFVMAQGAFAQEGTGGEPLVTKGDYVLQGTALVQYQGKTEEDLVIPRDLGITEIRDDVFWGNQLRSVVIPEGVRKLGSHAFKDCYNLVSVSIPKTLTSIGAGAFSSFASLTSVTIPDSVTSIGSFAFAGCKSLKPEVRADIERRFGKEVFE